MSMDALQTIDIGGIPGELKERPQWVGWHFEERDGELTKIPVNQKTGDNASVSNPATWGTFEEALAAVEKFGCDGAGFVFSESDDFFGIDLDDCRDPETGALTDWAQEIVDSVDSYTEVSPSGTGVKITARGKKPAGAKCVKKPSGVPTFGDNKPEIAIYDRKRFWTFTGQRLPNAPAICEPRQEPLDALLARLWPPKATSKGKPHSNGHAAGSWFNKLLSDSASAENGKRSEPDFALCAESVRRGCSADEIWARVASVGKFAEGGRQYFDVTWQNATEAVAAEPPRRKRRSRRIAIETKATPDANALPADAPSLRSDDGRTDAANAIRFALMFGCDVHWVDKWQEWLVWDGRRWEIGGCRIDALAKMVASAIWTWLGNHWEQLDQGEVSELLRWAKYTASVRGIENMLKLARSEPGIDVTPLQLDAHPQLFNCANGIIDLKTGKLLPHDRRYLLTKIAQVEYVAAAECPLWEETLNKIHGGDAEMVDFVHRLFGASLMGEVIEHTLPIFSGNGRNGKSLITETMLEVYGEYGGKAPQDLLLAKRGETHPCEKVVLFGKRLVFCVESDEGRRLSESTVKELVGGDTVAARGMRENFWDFRPSHTLVLVTNHKPRVSGSDHALWSRLTLVPFTVTFWNPAKGETGPPELKADNQLKAKLRAEHAGILRWLVAGCLAWQRDGLGEPKPVRTATAEYRAAEDVLAAFVDEMCIVGQGKTVKASELRKCLAEWCKLHGESAIGQKRLWTFLDAKKITNRTSNGTWYDGIGLLS